MSRNSHAEVPLGSGILTWYSSAPSARGVEEFMAQVCEICGKTSVVGNNVSHAHNVTKRRWYPNLKRVRASVEGRPVRLTVCTRCIRSGRVTKVVR